MRACVRACVGACVCWCVQPLPSQYKDGVGAMEGWNCQFLHSNELGGKTAWGGRKGFREGRGDVGGYGKIIPVLGW